MKSCTQCGNKKELSEFYRQNGRPKAACKECHKANVRDNRNSKLEAYRAYDRERRGLPHRIEQTERKNIKWRREQKHKAKAHRLMWKAIKEGILKQLPCARCGAVEVEGHHEDYAKPLDIMWLCVEHHNERHREINEERRNEKPN